VKRARIPTGIEGLDPLLSGGLVQGKSYLVTGVPGSGKSIFCLQFVLQGLRQGEKAVYVAVDETPADVLEQADSLGFDLSAHAEKKDLLVLDAASHFSTRAGKEKEVDLQRLVMDLGNYVKRMQATRVVIDPMGPLILLRDSASRIQDQARRLVHMLQSTMPTTNLLTCYPVPRVGERGEHGVEEFIVAGVFVLGLAARPHGWVRTLRVTKMRATPIDPSEREFAIESGRGIVLRPAP
jgi:circadian clock protein KaiC